MANAYVKRVMIDTGNSADILYFDSFQRLGLTDLDLTPLTSTLTGFTGDSISPMGTTTIPVTFGGEPRSKTLLVSFMVVKLPSAYNAIIGRPTLNRLRAVVSTYHRVLKFPTRVGVGEVRSDPRESRQCYLTATTLFKRLRTEPFSAMPPVPRDDKDCVVGFDLNRAYERFTMIRPLVLLNPASSIDAVIGSQLFASTSVAA
ncbi:hypothetical protein GW17_00058519 [Ensete ventricosum]|nr:hypothetical protein GW17_00058519 [Ensete ventricosum]